MRNNMDLICYPKTRDTCIYVGIRARFCLTMQCGHTEMRMPCVALSPNKHNYHNHPALKKKRSGNPGPAGNFTSSLEKSSKWLKNSSHHTCQENPSNKGMIRFHVVLVYKMEGPVHQGIGIK